MYVELETPPLMEKTILNFHFDYLNISLIKNHFFLKIKSNPNQLDKSKLDWLLIEQDNIVKEFVF